MDILTLWISSINIQILTDIAAFLNSEVVLSLITAGLVLCGERRPEKLKKIFFAAVLVLILTMSLKFLFAIERPCAELNAKIVCPTDYSFPSGHTLLVFTVAIAFLNKRSFPFYLVFALFVAFTRIYLGVHTIEDVAGGIALAPFVYYITDQVWINMRWNQ
ncbi:phosphatase PAP2 family protein [Candidatus Micrarchaeota archaeon]|nr:phosphatase PAP2 family protein [Candidatus Micrarchaeota archaeon]